MNKFFLFLFLTIGFTVFSQSDAKVKVTWGSEYKIPKKHADLGYIGNAKSGYTQIGYAAGKTISLQEFDSKFILKGEKLIPSPFPKNFVAENAMEHNGKCYLFLSSWEKSEDKEKLYVQEIDLQKKELVGKYREIISAPKLAIKNSSFSGMAIVIGVRSEKWTFSKSVDKKSKLLIQYRVKPEEKKDSKNKDRIGLFVFDQDMKADWGKEFEMPYTEAQMDNKDYYVDKQGNILLLAKVKEMDGNKPKKRGESHYEILKWSKSDSKTQIIPFTFKDKWGTEAEIVEDQNGKTLVVGYYSKIRRSSSADGLFVLSVNTEQGKLDDVFKGTYEFPNDIMKQFESERTKRKMDKKEDDDENEVAGLRFRSLEILSDGSLQVTGEQYTRVMIVQMTQTGPRFYYKHYYNDIYISRIGADGELKFVTKVPKSQYSFNGFPIWTGSMSLFSHMYKGREYIMFIDNFKNMNISASQAPATHTDGLGGVLMMVSVDNNGKTNKSKLFDFREEKRQLYVTNFDVVSENQIAGRTMGKKGMSKPFMLTFE